LVDAVPEAHGIAQRGFTGPDVEHVGCRRRDGEGPDRRDGLVVEDRGPGSAGVDRFPDAAVDVAAIVLGGPAGAAAAGVDAAAARWPGARPSPYRISVMTLVSEPDAPILSVTVTRIVRVVRIPR